MHVELIAVVYIQCLDKIGVANIYAYDDPERMVVMSIPNVSLCQQISMIKVGGYVLKMHGFSVVSYKHY